MARSLAVWLGIALGLVFLVACLPASPAAMEPDRPIPAQVPAPTPVPTGADALARGCVLPSAQSSTVPAVPTPTAAAPWPLLAGPGASEQRLAQDLAEDLAAAGYVVEMLPEDAAPGPNVSLNSVRPPAPVPLPSIDLYVGYNPPAGLVALPLTSAWFVPVVPFWLPVDEVSSADLERLLGHEVADWSALGSPVAAPVVPLLLSTDPPPPLRPAGAIPLTSTAALLAAFEQYPGGIALVPLEKVEVGMRALRVDGRDLLLEDSVSSAAPLARTVFLAWSPALPAPLQARLRAFGESQPPTSLPPAITIAVAGDLFTGRSVSRKIAAHGGDYTRPFTPTQRWLAAADLTVVNLEGVLSDRITPPSDPYTFLFVGSGHFTAGLRFAGVDAVSLGNNHSMNFGPQGLADTLTLLRRAGIVPFGAGMDLEEARRPALFEVKGTTFAFLGYDGISDYYAAGSASAGTAPADPALLAADIVAARAQADVVIPYFHWGWEYTHDPSPWQQQLAHQAVEAGAGVVLGSHPHWVQGLERYQGVPVVYSLGNFIADQMWSTETRQGVIALLIFRGSRLVGLRLQAIQIADYHQPWPLPPEQAQAVYEQMRAASPNWPGK